MSRHFTLTVVGAIALVAITKTCIAETLLGKNHLGGSFSIVQFGDDLLDEVLGNGYGFSGGGSINLESNVDLKLGVVSAWADGEYSGVNVDVSSFGTSAELVYFFKPSQQINPYIGAGLSLINTEVKASAFGVSESEDDTEVGYGLRAGVEIESTENVILRLDLEYLNIDDKDSVGISGALGDAKVDVSVALGYWFSEQVLGTIGFSHDFDSENASAKIGVALEL